MHHVFAANQPSVKGNSRFISIFHVNIYNPAAVRFCYRSKFINHGGCGVSISERQPDRKYRTLNVLAQT